MKRRGILFSMAVLAIGAFIGGKSLSQMKQSRELRIGFPMEWRSLVPALQSTMYGDAIITNAFETLVRLSNDGVVHPLAARSWTVSDDYKVFTFKIDTSRRFSNGVPLRAHHFKEAWEYGLSLIPESSNSSLSDALYLVEGAEDFPSTKKLKGVEAIDDETLRVSFKKPIRMALEYLSGGRLSVFLREGDQVFGTGPYMIAQYDQTRVDMVKNPFYSGHVGFDSVMVMNMKGLDPLVALEEGRIDVYYPFSTPLVTKKSPHNIRTIYGYEYAHRVIELNGLKGRLFSDPELRRAFQFLIYQGSKDHSAFREPSSVAQLKLDFQSLTHLQAGRLDDSEVETIIAQGAPSVERLVLESQKRPIKFVFGSPRYLEIMEYLKEKGIRFTQDSGYDPSVNIFELLYKTTDADAISVSFSVSIGDPDGLYHHLGENGSITYPMSQKKKTSSLLEEGRSIIKIADLPAHYAKVSRAILEEVPFVHLGFVYGQTLSNSDFVESDDLVVQRELTDFTNFRPSKTFNLKN